MVDVIGALTESPRPRKYWNALKTKLDDEGSELSSKLGQLKLKAQDGKMRETDVLDTKGIFRLIESIPSPKAEPFKLWLASFESKIKPINKIYYPSILDAIIEEEKQGDIIIYRYPNRPKNMFLLKIKD